MGLLLLRVVVGLLFVGHGTQKLFGWFGGNRIDGTAGFYDQLGYPRPRKMAVLAGATEAGAGLLLTLGLLTPLAAAAIIGLMISAIYTVHADNGLWNTQGGYEYNLVLIAAAAALAFAGPGALALDGALGLDLSGGVIGTVAIALGVVAAATVLAIRSAAPARSTAAATASDAETESDEEPVDERQAA